MTALRFGFDTKMTRARAHVAELEAAVDAFLRSAPFELKAHEEPKSGDLVYRVRVRRRPPEAWSAVVGDAVHNARSALDHVAWSLVVAGGGAPGENTSFPITDHEHGYGDKLRKALHGAAITDRAAVKALKPWRGGDDLLWRLHRLDIIDKHRLLVPVGAAQRGIILHTTFMAFDPGDEPVRLDPLELLTADRQYPLKDGAEVLRIMAAARDHDDGMMRMDLGATFEVAFGDGQVIDGEPLVPSLRALVDHVADVAEPFFATPTDGSD